MNNTKENMKVIVDEAVGEEINAGTRATEAAFQQSIDAIINPLINTAMEMTQPFVPNNKRMKTFEELFTVAILKGVEFAEQTQEMIDKANERVLKEHFEGDSSESETKLDLVTEDKSIEKSMERHQKERDIAAKLSVNSKTPDNKPRFATGDQFDPETGEYKG